MKNHLIVLLFITIACNSKPALDAEKIKVELDSIMVQDQLHRSELSALYTELGSESEEFQTVLEKQMVIDSSNLVYILDLINSYGKYPGKSLVGIKSGEVAFYILQHSPDSIQNKHLQTILNAAKEGELSKRLAAMFHDRYLLQNDQPQIYGSQIGTREVFDSFSGQIIREKFLHPIADTNKIDSLRLWNGLSPLEDYLNSYGISRWDND